MEINKDTIFFTMIGMIGILLVCLIYIMTTSGGECLRNPYLYGASHMKQVTCVCEQNNDGSPCPAIFEFNDTTFTSNPVRCGSPKIVEYPELNTTLLNSLVTP